MVGVFLASSEFAEAARAQNRAVGLDVPHVLVPHPIQDRTDEELTALTDQVYDAVVRAVTTGPDGPG